MISHTCINCKALIKFALGLAFFLGIGLLLPAQQHGEVQKMKPPKDFENIHVQKLESDAHSSSFLIWIRNNVRLHKHEHHSEHVYILKGKGEMTLGEKTFAVKKGDVIFIPEGTPHAVTVQGGPMQVISIQSPEFKGKDRIFLDQ